MDPSGEIVTAGGLDVFDIYVWSLQTGRLLEVLTGHEAPVAALQFSPSAGECQDRTGKKSMAEKFYGARDFGVPQCCRLPIHQK